MELYTFLGFSYTARHSRYLLVYVKVIIVYYNSLFIFNNDNNNNYAFIVTALTTELCNMIAIVNI